jgi:N-acetylglutamate synthase-like GNAT family acetyltransferase
MIRRFEESDFDEAHAIINEAAEAYRGVIPADRWHEPYMSREELRREIAAGVEFSILEEDGRVIGVMGVQQVRDAMLIRHAYVRKVAQRHGTGSALMKHLLASMRGRVMVGTWAAAEWAIRFYQRHGFRLAAADEKDRLLSAYWSIPDRQRETSVVLILEGSGNG